VSLDVAEQPTAAADLDAADGAHVTANLTEDHELPRFDVRFDRRLRADHQDVVRLDLTRELAFDARRRCEGELAGDFGVGAE